MANGWLLAVFFCDVEDEQMDADLNQKKRGLQIVAWPVDKLVRDSSNPAQLMTVLVDHASPGQQHTSLDAVKVDINDLYLVVLFTDIQISSGLGSRMDVYSAPSTVDGAVAAGQRLHSFEFQSPYPIGELCILKEGFVMTSCRGYMQVWNVESGQCVRQIHPQQGDEGGPAYYCHLQSIDVQHVYVNFAFIDFMGRQ